MIAKIGEGVPRLIDKTIDFMASSQAFMEYLKELPRLQHIPRNIPQDREALFLQRLEYYRQFYQLICDRTKPKSERWFLKGFF